MSVTGAAQLSLSTNQKRGGLTSLRANTSSNTGYISHGLFQSVQTARHYASVWIYIASAPSAITTILGAGTGAMCIKLDTDRTLKLYGHNGGQVGSASSAIPLNEWHNVQIDLGSSGSPTVAGRLDGSQFASGTDAGSPYTGWTAIGCGIMVNATADVYFATFAVNDTSGSVDTGFPDKDEMFVYAFPTSAGDNNQLKTSGGSAGSSTNYQAMDETDPDDGTTYLKTTLTSENGNIDDYNVDSSASLGIPQTGYVATIKFVALRARYYHNYTNGWSSHRTRVKGQASGTVSESADITPTTANVWETYNTAVSGSSYGKDRHIVYNNPQDSAAWEVGDIDGMQIGIKNTSNTFDSESRYSQVYAVICYVPVAVSTQTKTCTAKARVLLNQSKTVTAKATVKLAPPSPTLVSPSNHATGQPLQVTFVWEIPADPTNANVHCWIEVDNNSDFSSPTFLKRSDIDSGFEYWNGSSWATYPSTGVTSTYYGNQARITLTLPADGTYYWRVKGGGV